MVTSRKGYSLSGALKRLKVACILDEFTFHCFRGECDLRQVRRTDWREALTRDPPDVFFFESAWKGIDEEWYNVLSFHKKEFLDLLDYCRDHLIPIVFWSKEDPVHFLRFLPVAVRADYIFTTDADCVAGYKREAGHDRVYLLPFAAQVADHNPIEKYQRKDAFNFAGSYYRVYPERMRDFATLMEAAGHFRPVEIFDRNLDRPKPHDFEFPEEYAHLVKGTLPVERMDEAYKGYKYGININTIKQSQTMFARRVFELLASNTLVVSNFSHGLRLFFGDLVISSSNVEELKRRLGQMLRDEATSRKYRLAGLRKVFTEHTYADRFARIVSKISGLEMAPWQPRVCVVATPGNEEEEGAVQREFASQTYPNKKLFTFRKDLADAEGESRAHLGGELARTLEDCDYVAPFSARDHHGPNYLADLMLATRYTSARVIGKAARYEYRDGVFILDGDGAQYREARSLPVRASVMEIGTFERAVSGQGFDIDHTVLSGEGMFSTDEFNFCLDGAYAPEDLLRDAVGDIPGLDTGLALDHMLGSFIDNAPEEKPGERTVNVESMPGLSAETLYQQLPMKNLPRELTFSLDGDQLVVKSDFPEDVFKYVYFTRQYTRQELNLAQNDIIQFDMEPTFDVSGVFIYNDEDGKKIKHNICQLNRPQRLTVPVNTNTIRLGLRIKGSGCARLKRLLLFNTKQGVLRLIPRSECLILTSNYPAYDDLYKYGFLHARVRAYREQGSSIDIFHEKHNSSASFQEFENVDVVQGDISLLDQMMTDRTYGHLFVHVLTPRYWETISRHIETHKVTVWIHGAEIQPWFRRAFNHADEESASGAKASSEKRLAMWRELFGIRHENLRFIFISRYQYSEVMNDLNTELLPWQYEIIPNHISDKLFNYVEKTPEQRKRILSIRPYASRAYANDLSVKTIELLADEPFFKELHFRIIGDGVLFEETTAPLAKYDNVVVERRFLPQTEIAQLHKEYGVFLVPSRMDSQGVARDEAMSSGLVPVTNAVAAIPEFVDEKSGILADAEDAEGLAEGIRRLYRDPDLFLRMSRAASRKVLSISSFDRTIARELALCGGFPSASQSPSPIQPPLRIAIYGDVNLNVTDGSAVWAVSLAETLTKVEGVSVTLYLKAHVRTTHIVEPLLHLSDKLRLAEPDAGRTRPLTPGQALQAIEEDDGRKPYHAVILRGLHLCETAARSERLRGRIWPYLTDIPQKAEEIDDVFREKIAKIIGASSAILCQTRQFEAYFQANFPGVAGKTKLLTPMVPSIKVRRTAGRKESTLKVVYAGKFAPLWGIREMFHTVKSLRDKGVDLELNVYGDKIHNPPDDPGFSHEVREALTGGEPVVWHGAVQRTELIKALASYHVAWAYRDARLEQHTLELSTKLLEYASAGVPMILARNAINEEVLGFDYPLFAESTGEAAEKLELLARNREVLAQVTERIHDTAENYSFEKVAEKLRSQGLFDKREQT